MAAPRIAIYNQSHTALVSEWNVGTVKAQIPSTPLTINIWNNKGGSDDVSDLKECYIGVYDSTGNTADTDVPKYKWVEINVPSIDGNSTTWTAIGGTVTKNVKANGGVSDFSIKGVHNDGSQTNTSNFCTCSFRINPPINSATGTKTFNIRLTGYFT